MKRLRISWLVPAGSGGLGLGSLGLETASHISTAALAITGGTTVVIAVMSSVVAIVKIRTSRSPEARRMSALAKAANKINDPLQAAKVLMLEKFRKPEDLADGVRALSGPEEAARGENSAVPDVAELVKRADEGRSVIPPHPPEVGSRPENLGNPAS